MSSPFRSRFLFALVALSAIWCATSRAEMRVWTTNDGKTFQAEWVRTSEAAVVVRVQGREVEVPLLRLSQADQEFARNSSKPKPLATPAPAPPPTVPATPATSAAPAPAPTKIAGVDIVPGGRIEFVAPVPESWGRAAEKDGDPFVKTARIALAVPKDFTPAKSWPVLIVNVTSSGKNPSSVAHMNAYWKLAVASGWICLAADATEPRGKDDNAYRIGPIIAALNSMNAAWPGSQKWSYATAGHSGGAKRSGYVGAFLCSQKLHVIGMYMSGCNQDMASLGLQLYHPPHAEFTRVPVYISSGDADQIAPTAEAQTAMASMKKSGFQHVRLETFTDGHMVFPAHITEALPWFISLDKPK